jgi:hypothetical protein
MHVRSLVGYTSSNKPIYQFAREDYEHLVQLVSKFSNEDNFDAMAAFLYIQLVYWRRYGDQAEDYINAQSMLEFFEAQISPEYITQRKSELNLTTAFDLSNYGRKHCLPYLQELISS